MKRSPNLAGALFAALLLAGSLSVAATAEARKLGVEVWTDRGNDAVYQPGDVLQVRARATDDAYLLVYEIDSEGYVRLLYPVRGQSGLVEARETLDVPSSRDEEQLVVQDPTGEDYIVAIASPRPFDNLPWYLRPYDIKGDDVGYVNAPKDDDDQGITSEGKIVGDPFVAMERIRRRVLQNPNDEATFATAYTTYYVHEVVRYPRYICNDCHRPGRWAWWDGWDPYYTHCSVVDFRVNWSWGWGPGYWNGFVPYYVYVYRPDCPPRWRTGGGVWYSSWDGWRRWNQLWGGPLVRYKSPPPQNYVPPSRFGDWRKGVTAPPPGFVVSGMRRGGGGGPLPVGRNSPTDDQRPRRPDFNRPPDQRPNTGGEDGAVRSGDRRGGGVERMPARPERPEGTPREARDSQSQRPRYEPSRPSGRSEPRGERAPRGERGSRGEKSRDSGKQNQPRNQGDRGERGGRGGP